MTFNYPLISIITVVYNGESTLERCIRSVVSQSYKNIEYIIIDGNSSDQSVTLIKSYANKIKHWLSENDDGIYDAMNKAIDISKGEWVYFLGSDDYLLDENIILSIFSLDNSEYSIIIGKVVDDYGQIFTSKISWITNIYNTVHHQSAFYKKELFNDFRYDVNLKVVADYELNYLAALKNLKFKFVNQIIAFFSTSGLSKNSSEFTNVVDYYKIRKKYINFVSNSFFGALFFLNVLRRAIESSLKRQ